MREGNCNAVPKGAAFSVKISFFGHSDYEYDEEDEKAIIEKIDELVGDDPCDFLLGGIGAFDMFAKRCCIKYKQLLNPNVKLTLVMPYLDRKYNIKGYDDTVYPPLESVPKRLAIIRRNEWMVKESDNIIAYVWHYGGARNTLDIAKRKNKPIFNVALKQHPKFEL